jgi:hypothetical protein
LNPDDGPPFLFELGKSIVPSPVNPEVALKVIGREHVPTSPMTNAYLISYARLGNHVAHYSRWFMEEDLLCKR